MFRDALKLTLDLTIKNEVFNIPGGDITDFRVSLYPYGLEAQAAAIKDSLSGQLKTITDNAVGILSSVRKTIASVRSDISAQIDKLQNSLPNTDALTGQIASFKATTLQRLDQLDAQIKAI